MGWFPGLFVYERNPFHFRFGVAFVKLHLEFFQFRLCFGGHGREDGGISRLGLGCGAGGFFPRGPWHWPIFATRSVTAPKVTSSPSCKTCCPMTFLPFTKVPLELPRSRIVSLFENSNTSQ